MISDEILKTLKSGGIGVLPTDTLYGIVGRADSPQTVERIYELKGRNLLKPFIVLISSQKDLERFNVQLSMKDKELLKKYWPGKVSVILNVNDKSFDYLTRGSGSLAFRLPDKLDLLSLIKETGPIVAPSANPEGNKPPETIEEAKDYFGNKLDFYLDGGTLAGEPSTLITINKGDINVLRQGAVNIK